MLNQGVEWVEVTQELENSKEYKAMNPAGVLPMIEVSKGVAVCGTIAICKHLARAQNKYIGKDLLQTA
jgi:glutathione S-transferase